MNKFHHYKFRNLAATATLAAALLASAGTQAASFNIDVSGAQSINLQGEAGNTVWLVDIGANALLSSLDWTLQLSAFAPSSLGDMQVSFGSSSGLDAITLSPALGDKSSGKGSYAGALDMSPYGIAAGADGLLRIEFSEAYKDAADGVAEGQWLGGSLGLGVTAAVPEPANAALAALGLGLLFAWRRLRAR
ncbi:PEP-CTERM sorting domain-containing protein [Paucibacter sp. TC2R-5]|uniref:PEP-CTERM sorting domain-containing protein n=1 Tax=Paucibacter sp. TC2R-5 TaxID=2893555 RepID=UPI0021E445D7|nr:PEP-CTERM sorting domain-containing protein [Paucibacter sp. TC2R-5]MCV2358647.1 PEP-CTERM sorting domain-containing protein [Paucibacter sp. TC2R-5]